MTHQHRIPAWLCLCLLLAVIGTALPCPAAEATNSPPNLDRELATMESKLKESLATYRLASDYRRKCADSNQHDRAISFFRELAAAQPEGWRAQLELSCAYVDKIPTCRGTLAVVSQGALARKALDQADLVIARQPDLWVSHYVRGMNHLHWPRALLHAHDAVKDLSQCVALQEKRGGQGGRPCYLKVHLALGDAFTKAGNYKEARAAWQRGAKAFPDAKELRARLDTPNEAAQLR